ncbi:MAG: FAD-dependent monooxygenase [Bacteroidota bacterium]
MSYQIAGGGIGGLCLALALQKLGMPYHVYERAPKLREVGAGIWLAPNALQVLDWLGVLAKVQEAGNVIDRITLADAKLNPLSDIPQTPIVQQFGFSTVAIHRARLQKLLFDEIPEQHKTLGKALQRFEEREESVDLHFTDGTLAAGAYLIGADGIHSAVRQQLFPERRTRDSGQLCWRGIATLDLPDDYRPRGMELWGDQIRFGISQIADRQVYWFAVSEQSATLPQDPILRKAGLLARYESFHPLVGQILEATSPDRIMENTILDLDPKGRWYQGRICLMGDAAHATTPNMGQGGAQAIEDAYFLSQLQHTNPGEPGFAAFAQRRRPKVQFVVKQSWNTGKLAHWKRAQGLRNGMMRVIPERILVKQMLDLYRLEDI